MGVYTFAKLGVGMNFKKHIALVLSLLLFVSLVSATGTFDETSASVSTVNANYIITGYDMIISPNTADRTFTITCTAKIKALANVEFLNFYIDPVWKIRNIEGVKNYTQDEDLITVGASINKGSTAEITFHYATQFKGREYPGRQWNYCDDDAIYLYQWWYPVSLFTIAAGYSDIVNLNIQVQTAVDWIVCTTDVTKESVSGNIKTTVIEARDPAFFYHIVASKFKTMMVEDPSNVVSKVQFYGEEKYFEIGRVFANEIFGALSYFENLFGTPAPLEYSIIQMPDKFGTLMAERAQMFIPGVILDLENKNLTKKKDEEEDEEDKGFVDPEYLAEKVALSWWGGTIYGVGAESEFLNTSLAAYSGALYMADKEGEKKFIDILSDARTLYFEEIDVEDEVPLTAVSEFELLEPYFNGKGLIVYHMLRQVVGDAAFFKALKNYASRYAGKFATISDLEAEMSKASGLSLSWFFEQWILRAGRLTYEINFTRLPGENPFRYKVRLEPLDSMRMPFKIDVVLADRSTTSFEWGANDPEREKILEVDKEPIGAVIHNADGYMLTDNSKVNTLLEGPIRNYYYLDNLTIAEGTWQGNKELENKAHSRALFIQKMIKDKFNIEVPVKLDKDIDQGELEDKNLILVGCTSCNSLLAFVQYASPFWGTNYVKEHGPIYPGANLPEGTFVFPNPLNTWRGIIADEFFNSTDNPNTIDLNVDFYSRSGETGAVMQGYFYKRNRDVWKSPEPVIVDIEDFHSNKIETVGFGVTFEGTTSHDFYITYNLKNPVVFNEPVGRVFVPKGDFKINLELLRGEEFVDDMVILDAADEGVVFKRRMKHDFRGDLEPPVITIEDVPFYVNYGDDLVIKWAGRDNETNYRDLVYSWSIDGQPRTMFKTGSEVTLRNLASGKHSFRLWARDSRGNICYTIQEKTFIVE